MNQPKIQSLDLSTEVEALWPELLRAIERVLKSQQFIMGPDEAEFEQEVAAFLGVKHAISVNSGTDALVLTLRALDIGSGDEVITAPFSFFATAESISMVGARPVFADVQETTFNIDPDQIERVITDRTRAIMPVHLFGRPAEMEPIRNLAMRRGLHVVEDCAQSFGASYRGSQTGTMGIAGAYSFFPTKNLGAYGGGGLIATGDDRVADLARMLRAHGARKKYHNEILGYNSRLDTVQAAILRGKLPYVNHWNQQRRAAATLYNELLRGCEGIVLPELTYGHVFHQYTLRITTGDRDLVQAHLEKHGVQSMVYYPVPRDRLPVYDGKYDRYPSSELLASEVLSLPIWPGIGHEVQFRVAKELRKARSLL
jgi:dTDP-4-amino-4,6-dideoxygalactose transaminase